jgi:hypothetical protein
MPILFGVVAAAGDKSQYVISPDNLTLLDFTLGRNEIGDVEHRFGNAPVSPAPDRDMTQRCYESKGPDRMIVVFKDWVGTLSGFKVYKSTRDNPLCTKVSFAESDLSTASGLKLGLSRERVIQILGQPTKEEGARLVYRDESEKPLTDEDVAEFKRSHPAERVSDLKIWNFTEINLFFRNSKLSSIEVTHTETS